MSSIKLVGFAGSIRKASFNGALLKNCQSFLPEHCSLEIVSLASIPLYDGDAEESSGIPLFVQDLQQKIAHADGLIVVTPEYNASIPGVLKNTLDWLSRPPVSVNSIFQDKPLTVLGATTGLGGTRLAQSALLPVWRALGVHLFHRQFYVNEASKVFDEQLKISDEQLQVRLSAHLQSFIEFIKHNSK